MPFWLFKWQNYLKDCRAWSYYPSTLHTPGKWYDLEEMRDLAKTMQLDSGKTSNRALLRTSWARAVSTLSQASVLVSKLMALPELWLKSFLLSWSWLWPPVGLGRGVGVVDMRGKTGLWMLNFEPGGPAGLKEKRVGCKKWKARAVAVLISRDSVISPRLRMLLGGVPWELALFC